jgi:hypothetical protein
LRPARDHVAAVGVTLTLVAVLLQTGVHILNAVTFEYDALDADAEQTVFSWLASVTTFAAALACLLLVAAGLGRKRLLLPLAGLFAFLSLDEAISIHERLSMRIANVLDLSIVWIRVIWPIVYLPLLIAVLALLRAAVRSAPRDASRLVLVGLGCLAAAVVSELVSVSFSSSGFADALEVTIEEGLELAGWGLIATGLLSWLGSPRRGQGVPAAARQSSVK